MSKYGTYYLPTYRKFKAEFAEIIAKNRAPYRKAEGPLKVTVTCHVVKPKTSERLYPNGDVDNFAKAALDALNGIAWDDDDQIVELTVFKYFCTVDPSITVEVNEIGKYYCKSKKVRKLCVQRTRHKRGQPVRVRRRA